MNKHRDAPQGFAVRVGKKASVYLVDKLVAGRKLKIPVAVASGRKGSEPPLPLAQARQRAWELLQQAKKHGAKPLGRGIRQRLIVEEGARGPGERGQGRAASKGCRSCGLRPGLTSLV